jgi:hypothetical protein
MNIESCEVSISEKATCVLRLKNAGYAPARKLEIRMVIVLRETEPAPDEEMATATWDQIGILGVGMSLTHTSENAVTSEERERLDSGNLNLYCRGVIRYQTIFRPQPCHTYFCLIKRRGSIAFGPCARGNEHD